MTKTPLSQASGKKKLLIAGPLSALFALMSTFPKVGAGAKMLSVGLAEYAVVGLVEVLLGQRLVRASEAWERLPRWKKTVAGTVVVVASLVLMLTVVPFVLSR